MSRTWAAALAAAGLAAVLAAPGRSADKETRPFNGTDLKGWKLRGAAAKSKWVVGQVELDAKDPKKLAVKPIDPKASGGPGARALVNAGSGVDLYTEEKFGDCVVELEFMIPQGSNSGVYLMGEYEVQIFDSGDKKALTAGGMGGIYNTAAPLLNAGKKPGEWQKFVIDFRAPRFKDGKKVADARFVKVSLNGTLLHEDVAVKKPTGGGLTGKEAATGPLMFQGDHGPVAFRNVVIKPKKAE